MTKHQEDQLVIVFSLDNDVETLKKAILTTPCESFVLLSTHHLFESEQKQLSSTGKSIQFFDFSDIISEEEMVACDETADEVIFNRYGSRHGHLMEYYDEIRALKNNTILNNLKRHITFSEGLILDNSLGISSDIWEAAGLVPRYKSKRIADKAVFRRSGLRKALSFMKRLFPVRVQVSHCENMDTGEKCYMLGNCSRVSQYFSPGIKVESISAFQTILLGTLIQNIELSYLRMPIVARFFILFQRRLLLTFLSNRLQGSLFTVPIHEHRDTLGDAVEMLSADLWGIQDGYLPGNYTSCYPKYSSQVSGYLTWDDASGEMFERQNITHKTTSILAKKTIMKLPLVPLEINKVLILCSGAGDWTALKNRSDEDYMYEMFVQVSKLLPDVQFIYRPHPLWVYPEHQGRRSIDRLQTYCLESKLANLSISSGVRDESELSFSVSSLSMRYKSIQHEIDEADMIFGDHSQAVINAASEGKAFASVNATKRRSFFDNINRFGFRCCKSPNDIADYIHQMTSDVDAIRQYNDAVDEYNTTS